jgi:hypothetical protein
MTRYTSLFAAVALTCAVSAAWSDEPRPAPDRARPVVAGLEELPLFRQEIWNGPFVEVIAFPPQGKPDVRPVGNTDAGGPVMEIYNGPFRTLQPFLPAGPVKPAPGGVRPAADERPATAAAVPAGGIGPQTHRLEVVNGKETVVYEYRVPARPK